MTIVSGGQTGVDRAALEWALGNGVPHGGWCPKGRKAEDGIIPARFQLTETESDSYSVRTRRNVEDSDGTLIFAARPELGGGSRETAEQAIKVGKPLLVITLKTGATEAAKQLRKFIAANKTVRLNVAGPRESEAPGLGSFVWEVLSGALLDQ